MPCRSHRLAGFHFPVVRDALTGTFTNCKTLLLQFCREQVERRETQRNARVARGGSGWPVGLRADPAPVRARAQTSDREYAVDALALKADEGRGDRRNVQGELHASEEP